ncbi:MAG: hypothetical protein JWQ38_3247 [Flavipsychrobacter sp.]|nr:hypothetical protein [Flavipsychrobacter sp.]
MKRIALAFVFSLIAHHSFSQGMYGVEVGLGKAMSYKADFTPRLEGFLMKAVGRHVQVGGALAFERYSFLYGTGITADNGVPGDILYIKQKSTYTYFLPKIDVGFGYRQYIHAGASAGAGIFTSGSQVTNKIDPFPTPGVPGYVADHTTTNNIPTFMFRYGMSISERIPTKGFFNVVLSQQFGHLTKSFYTTPDLRTNYFVFSVGIMHNYNQVLVEY